MQWINVVKMQIGSETWISSVRSTHFWKPTVSSAFLHGKLPVPDPFPLESMYSLNHEKSPTDGQTFLWFRDMDSNHDSRLQRPLSCH